MIRLTIYRETKQTFARMCHQRQLLQEAGENVEMTFSHGDTEKDSSWSAIYFFTGAIFGGLITALWACAL